MEDKYEQYKKKKKTLNFTAINPLENTAPISMVACAYGSRAAAPPRVL